MKGGRGRAKKKQGTEEIVDEEKENTNEGPNENVDEGSKQGSNEMLIY